MLGVIVFFKSFIDKNARPDHQSLFHSNIRLQIYFQLTVFGGKLELLSLFCELLFWKIWFCKFCCKLEIFWLGVICLALFNC